MDVDEQVGNGPDDRAPRDAPVDQMEADSKTIAIRLDDLHARIQELENGLCEAREWSVSARNQTNVTRALCLPRLERLSQEVAAAARDISQCQAAGDDNRELRAEISELEHRAEDRLSMLQDCSTAVRGMHDDLAELKSGIVTLREVVEADNASNHECQNASEVSDVRFKFDLLLDNHNTLRRQFDCLARLVTNGRNLAPSIMTETRTREVTSASARHWVSHIVDVAKSAMPDTFGAKALELAHHRINNCTSSSAAIAAIVWAVLDFLTIAREMTNTRGLNKTSSSFSVLRLYNVLQPVTRHALVTLALAPGGWAHDSRSQIQATNELTQFLSKLALLSDIKGLTVSPGEPYTGFSNTSRDRWLPALAYGGLPAESPHLLLTAPPLFSFDNIDAFFCTHVSVNSWHSYLVRRQPKLVRRAVPLFSRPLFPNPWHPRLHTLSDAELDDDNDDWMTSEEAVITLLSWVGRVVLTQFIGDNHELTAADAREAIDMYQGARADIAQTIDSVLHGIVAHGVFQPSATLSHAIKFISSVLDRVAETGKTCTVLRGRDVSAVTVSAAQWLPGVSYLVDDTELTPVPANASSTAPVA